MAGEDGHRREGASSVLRAAVRRGRAREREGEGAGDGGVGGARDLGLYVYIFNANWTLHVHGLHSRRDNMDGEHNFRIQMPSKRCKYVPVPLQVNGDCASVDKLILPLVAD